MATEPAYTKLLFPLVVETQLVPQLKKRLLLADNDLFCDADLLKFILIKLNYLIERAAQRGLPG